MDFARIWRIAKTPVILLSLLLLVFLGFRWGWAQVNKPITPYVEPCVVQPAPGGLLKSPMVSVRVLNASNKRGKAAEVSQQLKRQGFRVTRVGNAEENQEKSVIIGHAPDSPEVVLLQQQFVGFETAGDGRQDHSVEVRIGENYQEMVAEAPVELPIPAETICLPKQETPTS